MRPKLPHISSDQFREHVAHLEDTHGISFGPGSIRTRGGLVLPAHTGFDYDETAEGMPVSINASVAIPDERGLHHELSMTVPLQTREQPSAVPWHNGPMVQGQTPHAEGIDVYSTHVPPAGTVFDRIFPGENRHQVHSGEEAIHLMKEPKPVSPEVVDSSREKLQLEKQFMDQMGLQDADSYVWRDADESEHVYDHRTGNLRPLWS